MAQKITVLLAGPGHEIVNYQMMPAFLSDSRLTVAGQATLWDALKAQLPVYKPEVLVIHGGLAPNQDDLMVLLSTLQAWNGSAVVVLPEGVAGARGALENMTGVVAGVYVAPVTWPEIPDRAYSAGETARARVMKVSAAPVMAAQSASAGMGYMPPGLQPILTGTKRVAILSHAGGAGVSTIAEGLAYELAVRLSIKTLLFSLGMPAAVASHLRLRYTPSMTDFFERPSRASIQSAIQRLEGLEVLVAPENSLEYLKAGQVVDTQAPNSIYAGLTSAEDGSYAAMIMDLPSEVTPWMLHPLAFANQLLIVARPTLADLFAVRHTLNALSILGSKLPRENTFLVLNQVSEASAFSPRQFLDELANAMNYAPQIAAVIEHDPNILVAQNQQVPAVTRSDKLTRGIRQIVSLLFPGSDRAIGQADENKNNGKSILRLPKFRFS
jgi:MinD-like ATPase involved in chromosome partitioning or flagellar assembly